MNDTPEGAAAAGGPPAYLLVQGKITDLEGFKAYSAALPKVRRALPDGHPSPQGRGRRGRPARREHPDRAVPF